MNSKVLKNASWIIICKVIQAVLALVINMLTARYLGPSNYGLITYAASLVAFAAPIMQLGINNILVQEIVYKPDREGEILGTSIMLSMISSLFCIAGVTAVAFALNPDEPVTVITCLLYSLLLLFQALDMIEYWFQAKLLSKYTSLISLCVYFAVAAYKIWLLVTKKSIYWFAVSNALDYGLIAIAAIIVYRRIGGGRFRFSSELALSMFNKSKHYIVSSMMVTIFAQTDKIMLKQMLDETATGYYGAAVACAALTGFIFAALIDSFRPSIFEGLKISEDVFAHRLTLLYSIIIYLSLAQSVAMTVLARLVIWILYGASYAPAAGALRIVVWYTTFSYIGSVRNIWILANNKQKYLWQINLSGALANVLLNWLLIPLMGIHGAALASLITQFFTNVVTGYILAPIRGNNAIMVRSIDPRILLEAIKRMRRKDKAQD
ncbi:MAG: flippase [Mogibacterium sp.]|nr:flippase [Mogibacterium sp.]MBQ6501001.1 flippase [Mogibacterium sp.]